MTTRDLVTAGQSTELLPSEVVQNATTQAKLLMDIVEKTHCYQQIRDKKYLQVEAWETIGAFNRTHAVTDKVEPIIREGQTVGYQAKVDLWRDGNIVGSATMPCFFTENACKGKEGDAKHKASMSAAQTFATSKAYRMNYAYVAILAGYQPLPAEEVDVEAEPVNPSEHYCPTHKVNFREFNKGDRHWWSHAIEGTEPVQWCNEPKETKPAKPAEPAPAKPPETVQEAPKSATEAVKPPDGTMSRIELLAYVQKEKGFRTDKTATEWLINVCHIEASRITNEPGQVYEEVKQLLGK